MKGLLMKQRTSIRSIGAVVLAVGLLAAACSTATASNPATVETTSTTTSAMSEHDMDSMNMGDPDAPLAASIDGADIVSGQFVPLPDAPANTIEGTVDLARHEGGASVTIHAEGLEPGAKYVSHVHADVCANGGGPHYQHEIGGSTMPPNEIHLAFTADGDGAAVMTTTNDIVANEFAVAVVIHRADEGAAKLVCADLE
jgi:hypothetical protein